MTLSNAERQARWRASRDAEIERLRKAAAQKPANAVKAALLSDSQELIEARKEIERLRKRVDDMMRRRTETKRGKRLVRKARR
jgi:hypothetical protein